MKKYKYYIGIDCGVTTGIVVWEKGTKEFLKVKSVKIHHALLEVQRIVFSNPGDVFVRMEDARLRKWIPKAKTESAERGRREGAGSVKRDAIIWEDFLKDLRVDFEMVAPKNNKTKVTADYFRKLTGYKEKTNEHERDAAMLVFGY